MKTVLRRLGEIGGVMVILLIGVAIGARVASTDETPDTCREAIAAANGVADMLESTAPNPGAAFDLTYHQLVGSQYRELAAQCLRS